MKKLSSLLGAAGVACALILVGMPAQASIDTHYVQLWQESPPPPSFDDIQLFVQAPEATNLSMTGVDNGWTTISHGPQWAEAKGTAVGHEYYTISFDYDSALVPVTVDFFAFLDNVMVDSAYLTIPGNGVTDPIPDAPAVYNADVARVPEPGTIALFGTALLALGFVAWRRRRDNSFGRFAAAA